jgi:uncharacterized surface protein with fasciclin (FAS1) repeats
MNAKWKFFSNLVIICCALLFLSSCEDDNKERFETPPWLGGSNIETLEAEGNCTIYLKLMEKANYREPIQKQLYTLFVPRDSAFNAYFQKVGISSVDDLTKDQAVLLFGLHVLRNPRSRFQLIYEWAWGELQGPDGEYASLFFRKRTRTFALPYTEEVLYDPALLGRTLIIDPDTRTSNQYKWVPLFSTDYMEDYFASVDGSDYEFIYRDSKWGGLQWHNARVVDAEVRTSSGFIYYLDQVVPPTPNIEVYLRTNKDRFGTYYDLMQRFQKFRANGVNDQNQSVYIKEYDLPFGGYTYNIANEQGPSVGDFLNHQNLYTVYAPTNEVMEKYLEDNVYPYYPSVDSLPELTLRYLVIAPLVPTLGMKSKIEKGLINAFGDVIEINPDADITDAYMCSNGAVYEMNRFLEPYAFSTVVGPLFFNNNYSYFLNALLIAELVNSVSSPEFIITLFAPTNEKLEQAGVRYEPIDNVIQFQDRKGNWYEPPVEELEIFVNNHIISTEIKDFSGEGFVEMKSGNYVYYNNNKIYGAGNFEDGDYTGFTDQEDNDLNGMLFYLDNVIKTPGLTAAEAIGNDPDFSEVYALFDKAGLLDTIKDPFSEDLKAELLFLSESNSWTMLMPTNAAIAQAESEGLIPEDPDELADFLKNHFIREEVIFDDGMKSGTFNTNYIQTVTATEVIYAKLVVVNNPGSLQITDMTGQLVNVSHANANKLIEGGVLHKINSVIKMPD